MAGICFLKGESGCGKTREIINRIRSDAENGKEVCLIVPEQFSSATEHRMYNELGIVLFNRIHVETFTRIKRDITKKAQLADIERSEENTVPSSAVCAAVMYTVRKELEAQADTMRYYKNQIRRSSFTSACVRMARELEMNGIEPSRLGVGAVGNKQLSDKISDIVTICGSYNDRLRSCGYTTAVSDGEMTAKKAEELRYFEGKSIYIDSFKSFTADQTLLINNMKGCADVTVAVTVPKSCPADSPVYGNVIEMMNKLDRDGNAKSEDINGDGDRYGMANDIREVSRSILTGEKAEPVVCENGEHIVLCENSTITDECIYVASEISRLVRTGKYKYSDITVVSRCLDKVALYVRDAFEIYDIPVFIDSPQTFSKTPLILFVTNLLEFASKESPSSELFIKLLKSGYTAVDEDLVYELENYYLEHGIRKESFERKNVFGVSETDITLDDLIGQNDGAEDTENTESTADDNDIAMQSMADDASVRAFVIRDCVMKHIALFREKCSGENKLFDICTAFCELINNIGTMKRVSEASEDEANETTAEFLWKTLGEIIEELGQVRLDEKNDSFTIRDFCELFVLVTSEKKIAHPSYKQNAVNVSSSDRARYDDPKVVFIMNAVSGQFPSDASENSMFTTKEIEEIESSLDIALSSDISRVSADENYIAVSAVAAPSEMLYISWALADTKGAASYPSALVGTISEMTGIAVGRIAKSSELITTERSALNEYIRNYGRSRGVSKGERLALCSAFGDKAIDKQLEDWDSLASELRSVKNESRERLVSGILPTTAMKLYTNENVLNFSTTSAENYNRCHFRYFCENGLGLKKIIKPDYTALVRGNVVHIVLNRMLSYISDEALKKKISFGECFSLYDKDALSELTERFMNEYYDKEFTQKRIATTVSFGKRYKHQKKSIIHTLTVLRDEFSPSNSRYVPTDFEYAIGSVGREESSGSMSPYRLDSQNELAEKFMVYIRGSVDRIDVFTDMSSGKEKRYVRIVDYKTGSKVFSLEKLADGLDMQLLIYMLAVTSAMSKKNGYNNCIPSGLFYKTAKDSNGINRRLRAGEIPSEVLEKTEKNVMSGIVLEEPNVIRGMEEKAEGKFIEAKLNTDEALFGIDNLRSAILGRSEVIGKLADGMSDRSDSIIKIAERLYNGSHSEENMDSALLGAVAEDDELCRMLDEYRLKYTIYHNFDLYVPEDKTGSVRAEIEEELMNNADKNNKTVSSERMEMLLGFVENKVREAASRICSGHIEKSPLESDGNTDPCAYCDYKAVCENYSGEPMIVTRKTPKDKNPLLEENAEEDKDE